MSIYTYTPKIKVTDVASHRNGICGAPFHVVLFEETEGTHVGIVFDEPYHCAVLNVQKLAQGDIKFGSNSYRGDMYEPLLRIAIKEYEAAIRNSIDSNL
jgi:hypothetical protein